MPATLILVRHAATEANLADPPRLQGLRHDPPLAPLGVLQTQATRDLLASRRVRRCVCSPLLRARQTAELIAAPHGVPVEPLGALAECDVGEWEGLGWPEARLRDPDACALFEADPWSHPYLGGESLRQVHERSAPALAALLRTEGETVAVSHHAVLRVWLAALLGLPPERSREVRLANASVSVVADEGGILRVEALNRTEHLPRA